MNHKVVVYVKKSCPYCSRAKELLDRRGVSYTVVDITDDPGLAAAMVERSGGRKTVPQIFVNNVCIGGFDELNILNENGKLNELLFLDD